METVNVSIYKDSVLGLIPRDWDVKLLPEVFDYIHGKAHEQHINENGKFIVVNSKFISTEGSVVKKSEENFCPAKTGDILTVLSDLPNGKALAKIFYVDKDNKYAVNQRICIWRSKKDDSRFLSYIMNRNKYFLKYDDGVTQTHILNHHIEKCPVLVPRNVLEQKAIAQVLSDTDALIQALEKKITKKKLIKKGVMQRLLTPKDGWIRVKLEDEIDVNRGGSPRPIQDYITDSPSGVNWIKIGDTSAKSKYITSAKEKIIEEGVKSSREVNIGDFLLSNSMSFGRPHILKIDGCIHDGWLVLQNYQKCFDREFLYYTLMSEDVFNQYLSKASGSGVLNLNKELVKTVELNRPKDINEQVRIAKILTDIDEEIEILEHKLFKYQLAKQGMMQQLLTGKIRLV